MYDGYELKHDEGWEIVQRDCWMDIERESKTKISTMAAKGNLETDFQDIGEKFAERASRLLDQGC